MKQKLSIVIVLLMMGISAAYAQNYPTQSVSIRLGVPIGVTYKTYVGKREAFEFGIGGVSPYWAKQYYINSFNSYSKYKNFKYIDHNVQSTVYFQGRYLKDFAVPTSGMEGQLTWYCGAGAVLKLARLSYTYQDVDAIPVTQVSQHTDIDFGPEAILGAEYWMEDAPFSFYGESSAMLELADRIGSGRFFIAVGARYHFSH